MRPDITVEDLMTLEEGFLQGGTFIDIAAQLPQFDMTQKENFYIPMGVLLGKLTSKQANFLRQEREGVFEAGQVAFAPLSSTQFFRQTLQSSFLI